MQQHNFTLRLTSDGEPGTGLGSELVNDFIPRNYLGQPVIPATHLKGLMRAALVNIAEHRKWGAALVDAMFGTPGHEKPDEHSVVSLADASATDAGYSQIVARTKIGRAGVVVDKSLRSTEVVAIGTEFHGRLFCSSPDDSVEDLAWRLALLGVSAFGGNRNRGSGACQVHISDEKRSPGDLLKLLDSQIGSWNSEGALQAAPQTIPDSATLSGKTVVMRAVFTATTPICCPEIADRSNVISTGFSIPASTFQGALLTSINRVDPSLATALFENKCFRAWPLQPIAMADASDDENAATVSASRVSLTHKAAKYSVDQFKAEDFEDASLDSKRRVKGAPMKSADGVLRFSSDPSQSVELWRAGDMPHVITAHGVHAEAQSDRERNLFTVDSMVPMVWEGLLTLPADAVDKVQRILNQAPKISIGKSRTVRGHGSLDLQLLPEGQSPPQWQTASNKTVWIVQSPIMLPAGSDQTPQQQLEKLAHQWARKLIGSDAVKPKVWATNGILFGYNRTRTEFRNAQHVVLPGSVIDFQQKIDDQKIFDLFTSGEFLPDQRQRGYGNFAVHPGKASNLYRPELRTEPIAPAADSFAEAVRKIQGIAKLRPLPSGSQIRAVQAIIETDGPTSAADYLARQLKKTNRIWSAWEACHPDISQLLTNHPKVAARALGVLANLTQNQHEESE